MSTRRYADILKDLVETIEQTSFDARTINVSNKFIIREEFCDFETDVDLSNNDIMNVNTISPCQQINCGYLTLNSHTISDTSGANLLINNVQKINNKFLPSGDFFGKEDSLSLSQISDGLITTAKIADSNITLPKLANIGNNTILGNNSGTSAAPSAISINDLKTLLSISNQTITLSGDVSGSGSTSISTTLANSSVSLAKMSNLAANSIIGNNTGFSNIAPKALNVAEIRTMLSITNVDNVSLNSWTGSTNITQLGTIPGLTVNTLKVNNGLNMSSQNITNLGNINSFSLPASNFVGVSDAQTLTNKNINASQLVGKSVTLDKMANIGSVTLLGNTNAFEFGPAAISAVNVKTMLDLAGSNLGDQNLIGDVVSSGGPTTLSTTISNGVVTLAKMSNLAANSIIGNNTGSAAVPKALTVNEVKSLLNLLGNLTITNNDITSSTGILNATIANITLTASTLLTLSAARLIMSTPNLSIDFNNNTSNIDVTGVLNMKSNNIINIGAINNVSIPNSAIVGTSSNQTLTNKIIDGDQLVLNSVALSRLTSIASQSLLGNKEFLTGVPQVLSATQAKTILSLQNVQNIDVMNWAGSANMTMVGNLSSGSLAAGFGNVNCGTISCTSLSSKTRLLTINGVGADSEYPAVVTNNSAILISSSVANRDSMVVIDGPTIEYGRYIACNQNGVYKLAFGLQSSNNFFVYDPINAKTMFQTDIGAANPIRFPTYTTEGTAYISAGGTIIRTSDRRLKQDEELLNSSESLQKIMELQPKKYCWISDPSRVKIGFIAQDVETAIPEAIDGKKYEYELVRDGVGPGVDGTIRLDEEGNPVLDYDKPRYRGLDNCAILSTLVSAFQKSIEKINALEARIAELENQT